MSDSAIDPPTDPPLDPQARERAQEFLSAIQNVRFPPLQSDAKSFPTVMRRVGSRQSTVVPAIDVVNALDAALETLNKQGEPLGEAGPRPMYWKPCLGKQCPLPPGSSSCVAPTSNTEPAPLTAFKGIRLSLSEQPLKELQKILEADVKRVSEASSSDDQHDPSGGEQEAHASSILYPEFTCALRAFEAVAANTAITNENALYDCLKQLPIAAANIIYNHHHPNARERYHRSWIPFRSADKGWLSWSGRGDLKDSGIPDFAVAAVSRDKDRLFNDDEDLSTCIPQWEVKLDEVAVFETLVDFLDALRKSKEDVYITHVVSVDKVLNVSMASTDALSDLNGGELCGKITRDVQWGEGKRLERCFRDSAERALMEHFLYQILRILHTCHTSVVLFSTWESYILVHRVAPDHIQFSPLISSRPPSDEIEGRLMAADWSPMKVIYALLLLPGCPDSYFQKYLTPWPLPKSAHPASGNKRARSETANTGTNKDGRYVRPRRESQDAPPAPSNSAGGQGGSSQGDQGNNGAGSDTTPNAQSTTTISYSMLESTGGLRLPATEERIQTSHSQLDGDIIMPSSPSSLPNSDDLGHVMTSIVHSSPPSLPNSDELGHEVKSVVYSSPPSLPNSDELNLNPTSSASVDLRTIQMKLSMTIGDVLVPSVHTLHNYKRRNLGAEQWSEIRDVAHYPSNSKRSCFYVDPFQTVRLKNEVMPSLCQDDIETLRIDIKHFIGRGRLGDVFGATMSPFNTYIAVKIVAVDTFPGKLSSKREHSYWGSETESESGYSHRKYTWKEAEDALLNELDILCGPLRSLQGAVVPSIYGAWETEDRWKSHGEGKILAVSMEHVGTDKRPLTPADKEAIIALYNAIHAHGIVHGDVERRHLRSRGEVNPTWRLIDFEGAWYVDRKSCKGQEAIHEEMRQVHKLLSEG